MVSRARPFALRRLVASLGLAALESATGCSDIVGLECESSQPCEIDGVAGTCIDGRCVADVGTTTSSEEDGGSGTAATTGPDPGTSGSAETRGDEGPVCGNGIVEPGEECEDLDRVDIDECSNSCLFAVCGDGIVQTVEDCDLGVANFDPSGPCKPDCTPAICGDGVVRENHEVCDGTDFQGLTCESLGLPPGRLWCWPDCNAIDTYGCGPCWPQPSCEPFQPCDLMCENESLCYSETGRIGTCLPPCVEPFDCAPHPEGFESICLEQICVIPCDELCPEGMICTPTLQFGMVCLW